MPAASESERGQELGTAFLLSVEQELMTVVRPPGSVLPALQHVLRRMVTLAPALPDPGMGFFNPYGRVYVDTNCHLELAALECDDPYRLAILVETQQALLRRAVTESEAAGVHMLLANNNHDGLLQAMSPTWGAHENYLVARSPRTFTDEIMPFLVTRTFAGSGGVRFPAGARVAGVRPVFMAVETGGDTTCQRAIHSTAREEHHCGPRPRLFRYHLIVGDGHRSQFNLALQTGATALVLRVLETDADFGAELRALCVRLGLPLRGGWLATMAAFNHLAAADEPARVHPAVLEVQAFHLDAARRWARNATTPPPWVARCLQDWHDTLAAMARGDDDWLAARLDSYAKHRLLGAVLAARGLTWSELRSDPKRFGALTLVEHSFHDLVDPQGAFQCLDDAGALCHRVGEPAVAGSEPEPFVPAVNTRARARARFLVQNRGTSGLLMDWSQVVDRQGKRCRALTDPFATEYGEWAAIA